MDVIGIEATRMNARLLMIALNNEIISVPENVELAKELGEKENIVVMGGTVPGHTTDAVSVYLSEIVNAVRLVNATSVDGVYTADPNKFPDAKKIEAMTYDELKDIILKSEKTPGQNLVLDHSAAKKLAELELSHLSYMEEI